MCIVSRIHLRDLPHSHKGTNLGTAARAEVAKTDSTRPVDHRIWYYAVVVSPCFSLPSGLSVTILSWG